LDSANLLSESNKAPWIEPGSSRSAAK